MHRPYGNAVGASLPKAEVIHDKFHVLQHAGAALHEVRRHEFFRAGAVMRAFGRGKRWLLLRRWKTVRASKRTELTQLFATNRRLFNGLRPAPSRPLRRRRVAEHHHRGRASASPRHAR
jgi:transposase